MQFFRSFNFSALQLVNVSVCVLLCPVRLWGWGCVRHSRIEKAGWKKKCCAYTNNAFILISSCIIYCFYSQIQFNSIVFFFVYYFKYEIYSNVNISHLVFCMFFFSSLPFIESMAGGIKAHNELTRKATMIG